MKRFAVMTATVLMTALPAGPALAGGRVVAGPDFHATGLIGGSLQPVRGARSSGAGAYTIQGRIDVDHQGKKRPVPGLQVTAADHRTGKPVATAVSDSGGIYRLAVPKTGDYEVMLTNRMAKDIGFRTWAPTTAVVSVK